MTAKGLTLFSDIDGTITPNKKGYLQEGHGKTVYTFKTFCDHDISVLRLLKDKIVFITQDQRINRWWCNNHDTPCILVPQDKEKYYYLQQYRKENKINKYVYVGDALPDFECLKHATKTFVPNDASKLLIEKLRENNVNYTILLSKGGEGVLEEVYMLIRDQL